MYELISFRLHRVTDIFKGKLRILRNWDNDNCWCGLQEKNASLTLTLSLVIVYHKTINIFFWMNNKGLKKYVSICISVHKNALVCIILNNSVL